MNSTLRSLVFWMVLVVIGALVWHLSTTLQTQPDALTFSDFMAGFVKSFVFAILIAGIGCLRGLQTTAGASSVGDAATRAVVSGIILLVVVDGIFAVLYYVLDI